jgi:dihydrofolate reductase
MARLNVFIMMSLDGCYADAKSDMSFAHAGKEDAEYQEFVQGNAKGGGLLLFGRVTYELMTQYWPTPAAMQQNPVVAERMNSAPKVVFSRSMKSASWNNTRLVNGDIAAAVKQLKEGDTDMTTLGSGSVVTPLEDAGLIDQYTVVIVPVVLGAGKRVFDGALHRRPLTLTKTRSFQNGKLVLYYEPAK